MTPKAAPRTLLGHYAGFTSRTLAFIIDAAIIGISVISISWLLNVTVTMLQLRSILSFTLQAMTGSERFLDILFGPTVASVLSALFVLGYHMFFLVILGQTPGKAAMGLRVVRMTGQRLNVWRALLRLVGYLISAIPLGLGFLWIFVDDRRQAWHDKLAGTCVIYTWAARPDERFLADETKQLNQPETAPARMSTNQ